MGPLRLLVDGWSPSLRMLSSFELGGIAVAVTDRSRSNASFYLHILKSRVGSTVTDIQWRILYDKHFAVVVCSNSSGSSSRSGRSSRSSHCSRSSNEL